MSVFDLPAGVDLTVAIAAERLFRAAGLSRQTSLILIGLGFTTLDSVRGAPWEDQAGAMGLKARIAAAPNGWPVITAEVDVWRQIPSGN